MKVLKNIIAIVLSVALIVAAVLLVLLYKGGSDRSDLTYNDGTEYIDPNTIELGGSGVRVTFSEVILSKPTETRKLVVFEQSGSVSYTVEDRLWDLGFAQTTKTQKVEYTGKGSFVVDLDKITQDNIIDDTENKTLTIKIPHPRLDTIEINPDEVKIEDTQNGFFTIGDIKLTLSDYNQIESELRKRLVEKFDTSSNGQQADDIALEAVHDIYYPVVQAVDSDYERIIEFQ